MKIGGSTKVQRLQHFQNGMNSRNAVLGSLHKIIIYLEDDTMKKLIPIMLVLVLTLSLLAGCGGETPSPEAQSSSQKPTTTAYTKDSPEIKELEKKNIDLVKIYNEVTKLAIDNGWQADELTVKELNAVNTASQTFSAIIKDPPSANGADLPGMLKSVDELITELRDNTKQKVSVAYANKQ
jgi:hypothetical protein